MITRGGVDSTCGAKSFKGSTKGKNREVKMKKETKAIPYYSRSIES